MIAKGCKKCEKKKKILITWQETACKAWKTFIHHRLGRIYTLYHLQGKMSEYGAVIVSLFLEYRTSLFQCNFTDPSSGLMGSGRGRDRTDANQSLWEQVWCCLVVWCEVLVEFQSSVICDLCTDCVHHHTRPPGWHEPEHTRLTHPEAERIIKMGYQEALKSDFKIPDP